MSFTAKDVAVLREKTGAGMMDCKKALTESGGDMVKAEEYLRKQGINIAAKKAGRIASEGIVAAYADKNRKTGVLVEINCESDFVGKSAPFVGLAEEIAKITAEKNPKDLDALLKASAGTESVEEKINAATAKIGEKLSLRRFERFEVKNGYIEYYIHMGGKIGVLLEVAADKDLSSDAEFTGMCHDIALHIAALSPKYVDSTQISKEELEYEMNILRAQSLKEGKPEAVVEKMLAGRIKKYFKEICLVEQEFVKDSSVSVSQVVDSLAKKLSTSIKIIRFARLTMGEGLEKKVDNLAEEVAKMQNR